MKNIMTKFMAAAIISIGCLTGCKTVPTAATVNATSHSVGIVAGYACELTSSNDNVKTTIVQILDTAIKVVPATNETFEVAWKPVVEEEISKLQTANKINELEGVIVRNAVTIASSSIDFMLTRHQNWKEYNDLVSVAVNGFVNGFKSVVNGSSDSRAVDFEGEIDAREIYEYNKFITSRKK